MSYIIHDYDTDDFDNAMDRFDNDVEVETPTDYPAKAQKYKTSCDHRDCRPATGTIPQVTVYNFPPKGVWKFGETIRVFCWKHFAQKMGERGFRAISAEQQTDEPDTDATNALLSTMKETFTSATVSNFLCGAVFGAIVAICFLCENSDFGATR